jgi:diguanylate cyclase (GGDEF)-like protein
MDEAEFALIAPFFEFRRASRGVVVFTEGDTNQELFILVSGELNAHVTQPDGTQRWLYNIYPVNYFGEMAVIAREPQSATVIARQSAEMMVLRGADFYRIISDYPRVAIKMLGAIADTQNRWLEKSFRHLGDLLRWGETARRRAITDDLTGLYNRSFLEESIKDRFSQGSVGLRQMSLLMMDLDRVHEINERHGVKAGDQVIITMAEILGTLLRSEDISARLSGDEFAALLIDADGPSARMIADRIREAAAFRAVAVPETPGSEQLVTIPIRISIGIAVAPAQADNGPALMSLADAALRRAKVLGRNRVELAS